MTKDDIIAAILRVAGNPNVGAIKDLAPAMADAILAINVRSSKSVEKRETR